MTWSTNKRTTHEANINPQYSPYTREPNIAYVYFKKYKHHDVDPYARKYI